MAAALQRNAHYLRNADSGNHIGIAVQGLIAIAIFSIKSDFSVVFFSNGSLMSWIT